MQICSAGIHIATDKCMEHVAQQAICYWIDAQVFDNAMGAKNVFAIAVSDLCEVSTVKGFGDADVVLFVFEGPHTSRR